MKSRDTFVNKAFTGVNDVKVFGIHCTHECLLAEPQYSELYAVYNRHNLLVQLSLHDSSDVFVVWCHVSNRSQVNQEEFNVLPAQTLFQKFLEIDFNLVPLHPPW